MGNMFIGRRAKDSSCRYLENEFKYVNKKKIVK